MSKVEDCQRAGRRAAPEPAEEAQHGLLRGLQGRPACAPGEGP
jgi:hypothetical protein